MKKSILLMACCLGLFVEGALAQIAPKEEFVSALMERMT